MQTGQVWLDQSRTRRANPRPDARVRQPGVGKREIIAKEVDMDSRGVVEVIAKEVDDERLRKQQQKITQQQQNRLCGRPARSTARTSR